MLIRPMQFPELGFAAECTAAEGWASETRAEFEGFFANAPDGCFIAEADGQRAGIAIATPHGEYGYIGEVIVIARLREKGIGRQLLDRCVEYLHSRGAKNIYLDGVVRAVPLYERAGFRKLCRSLRFTGSPTGKPQPRVRTMRAQHLEAVVELDRSAFKADRSFFLKRRLSLYPDLCKVLLEDGQVNGFIMGRRGHGVITVGPWSVRKSVKRPGDLLESLANEAGGQRRVEEQRIALGVLETNTEAVAVLRSLGFTERLDPPWRMVLSSSEHPVPSEHLGASIQCFAIGSPATG
jgi:ribosomal protein S18 acetylase RimI-like enzyme